MPILPQDKKPSRVKTICLTCTEGVAGAKLVFWNFGVEFLEFRANLALLLSRKLIGEEVLQVLVLDTELLKLWIVGW